MPSDFPPRFREAPDPNDAPTRDEADDELEDEIEDEVEAAEADDYNVNDDDEDDEDPSVDSGR